MATPLGHALAGAAVGRLADETPPGSRWLLGACVALAVAPDLDFIPGWVAGTPTLYHQGPSHSFCAAVLAAVLTAALLVRTGERFLHAFGWLFVAYASHLLLDWLGNDTRAPIGIPLFWPFSDATFLSPVALLPGVAHSPTGHEGRAAFLASLLDWRNVVALGVETLVGGTALAFAEWWRRRRVAG